MEQPANEDQAIHEEQTPQQLQAAKPDHDPTSDPYAKAELERRTRGMEKWIRKAQQLT